MYVCICNAVTDQMIRAAAADGAVTVADLRRATGCAGTCGSCADFAAEVLAEARSQQRVRLPQVLQAVGQAA